VRFDLKLAALVASVLAACSSSSATSSDDGLIEGFNPPAPGADQIRVMVPIVENIQPGQDLTWCAYIANPFADKGEVDVVQSRGFQSKSGHHALLMEVPGAESSLGQSHECTDRDMNDARFLAGGSDAAAQFQIPEGIGFRIKPASVLMVQSHWINTGTTVLRGQTVFNVKVLPPDPKRQAAQLFATFTLNVTLPPRAPAHAHAECTVQKDLQFFAIGGHAHEYGKHVRLSLGDKVLYDQDWQPHFQSDPPLNYYDIAAPLVFHKGDVLNVDCDYQNTTDSAIQFPREMCVGEGFYFPGDADIHCGDGQWDNGGGGAQ
jgi:hypothetical protein